MQSYVSGNGCYVCYMLIFIVDDIYICYGVYMFNINIEKLNNMIDLSTDVCIH